MPQIVNISLTMIYTHLLEQIFMFLSFVTTFLFVNHDRKVTTNAIA